MIVSQKPSGDQYRTVGNIFAVEFGGVVFPVWSITRRSNAVVSSHLTGRQDWTKYGISNIYMDSEGNVEFETDTKPHATINSDPPSGYSKVSNIYYDISSGEVIVE